MAYQGYAVGETAAFPREMAAELFERKIAEPVELQKPRDRTKDVGFRPRQK